MMNRRELFKRMMVAGLAVPMMSIEEPIKRFFPLDRTMIPDRVAAYEVKVTWPVEDHSEELTWTRRLLGGVEPLPSSVPPTEIATRLPLNYTDDPHSAWAPKFWPPQPLFVLPDDPNWMGPKPGEEGYTASISATGLVTDVRSL